MSKVIEYHLSEDVLDKVMHLFWGKGFFATSIDEVVKITGLNRGAIYKYFGGKEQLYVAMLKRYLSQVTFQLTKPLLEPSDNPVSALQTFFSQFTQAMSIPVQQKGCFLVMTATDLPLKSDATNQVVNEFLSHLQQLLSDLLSQAIQQGICDATLDHQQTTSFLIGNIMGLMTLLRAQAPKVWVDEHIAAINQYLESLKYGACP